MVVGCGKGETGSGSRDANASGGGMIKLSSASFRPDQPIPAKHSKDGGNSSPPLTWMDVPEKTVELALIVDDSDASGFAHWVLYGIPQPVASLAERVAKQERLPNGMLQGKNGFDAIGYDGPQPPGGTHHYHFRLYALDEKLALKPGATKDELLQAMKGHIIGTGELTGTFRPGGNP